MDKLPPFKYRGPFLVQVLERNFIEYLRSSAPACPTQQVLSTLQGREGSKRQIQFQLEGREPKSQKAFHPCPSLLRFQFADSRKHRLGWRQVPRLSARVLAGASPVTEKEISESTLGLSGLL